MNRLVRFLPKKWQYWASEWGNLSIAGVIFVACSIAYFAWRTPDKHVHAGYVPGKVQSTFDTSDELRYDVRGVVALPDGQLVVVRASSIAMAQWLIDEACIERRQAESGRTYYRLAAPAKCGL